MHDLYEHTAFSSSRTPFVVAAAQQCRATWTRMKRAHAMVNAEIARLKADIYRIIDAIPVVSSMLRTVSRYNMVKTRFIRIQRHRERKAALSSSAQMLVLSEQKCTVQ